MSILWKGRSENTLCLMWEMHNFKERIKTEFVPFMNSFTMDVGRLLWYMVCKCSCKKSSSGLVWFALLAIVWSYSVDFSSLSKCYSNIKHRRLKSFISSSPSGSKILIWGRQPFIAICNRVCKFCVTCTFTHRGDGFSFYRSIFQPPLPGSDFNSKKMWVVLVFH